MAKIDNPVMAIDKWSMMSELTGNLTDIKIRSNATSPKTLMIDCAALSNNGSLITVPNTVDILTIKNSNIRSLDLGENSVLRRTGRKIYFQDGCRATDAYNSTANTSNVYCYGEIAITGSRYATVSRFIEGMIHVELKQNSLPSTLTWAEAYTYYYNEQTYLQLANCLKDEGSDKVVQLCGRVRTILEGVIGVSTLDPTETYHVFSVDPNGTMSYIDFITDVKGRTLTWSPY